MSVQSQLFPEPREADPTGQSLRPAQVKAAPVWLQRISLFILVLFCVYLGVLVTVLPWWIRVWDNNMYILAHPTLSAVMHNGAVRGLISGMGMLDIWIGISEAVHYRDYRG